MSDLLPPNASGPVRDIEAATARLGAVDVPIDRLWDPQTCPAAALPWLAWALSVDVWNPAWPEAVKRDAVADAYRVHRKKGTIGALKQAVAALGVIAEITEWFDKIPAGTPMTFGIDALVNGTILAGITPDERTQRDLIAAVTAAKNARSHFDMVLSVDYGSGLGLAAGLAAAGRAKADAAVGARDRVSGGIGLAAAIAGAGVGKAHAPAAGRNGVTGGIGLAGAHHPVNFVNIHAEVA